jgi:hypothetical protein
MDMTDNYFNLLYEKIKKVKESLLARFFMKVRVRYWVRVRTLSLKKEKKIVQMKKIARVYSSLLHYFTLRSRISSVISELILSPLQRKYN